MKWSRLGELIFGNNVSKEEELKSLRRRHDDIIQSPVTDSVLDPSITDSFKDPFRPSSMKRRSGNNKKTSIYVSSALDESTIESLIDKMKSGMEVRSWKAAMEQVFSRWRKKGAEFFSWTCIVFW